MAKQELQVSDSEEEEVQDTELSEASAGSGGGEELYDEDDQPEPSPRSKLAAKSSRTPSPTQSMLRQQKEANARAMLSGRLDVQRAPLLPKVLTLAGAEATLRQPFKSPHPTAASRSLVLNRKLAVRRRFVPWGGGSPLAQLPALQTLPPVPPPPEVPSDEVDTNPLTLWEPPAGSKGSPASVDKMLTKWLRPHQREGVQFLFECVTGIKGYEGAGCILADDMGLGKTLQGITLIWTLLKNGHELLGGDPIARRCIICCPTSLVSNWESECKKWLQGRLKTTALCEASRDDVIASLTLFLSPRNQTPVLIISYETFRLHALRFSAPEACDLLICDEAHRLKSDQTLTSKALDSLHCRRRVLLSGTPMQNHLDEFYAMVNFCNPNILGPPASFRKRFEAPILRGREPDATESEAERGQACSTELSTIVNAFILRRTNALLSQHLPPKVIEVVCCKMTELQQNLYCHFLESNITRHLLNADGKKSAKVLSAITSLKKLCNHPKLIYDTMMGRGGEGPAEGFEGCEQFFLPGMFDDGRAGRGQMAAGWEALSGKFAVLATMLAQLRERTDDRIVIVSNYTQTLDLIAHLCRQQQYPFIRLDGSTGISKRQKLVVAFNDPKQRQFVFLLSSKAGGCGLNLVGGNRLVLFDPDWNPATDKQAAGRVWRDGQKKRVFVYRFLASGTIEEKVYQRQLSKEGLQSVVNSAAGGSGACASNAMSSEDLRDLFTLRSHTRSDTYDCMCAEEEEEEARKDVSQMSGPGSCAEQGILKAQGDTPAEEDLKNWGHHSDPATLPDKIMQSVGAALPGTIRFVFTNQVAGKAIEAENEAAHVKAAQSAPASASPISVPFAQTSAQLRTPAPVGSHQPSRLSLSSARSRLQSASIQPQQQQQTPRDAQPEAQQQQQQHRFELCPPQQGSASQEQQHQQQRHRMSPVDVSRSSVAADNMRQEATSLSASEPTPQANQSAGGLHIHGVSSARCPVPASPHAPINARPKHPSAPAERQPLATLGTAPNDAPGMPQPKRAKLGSKSIQHLLVS